MREHEGIVAYDCSPHNRHLKSATAPAWVNDTTDPLACGHDNDLQAFTRDSFVRGNKHYELKNHLGNVQVVVTDRKIGVDMDADSLVDFYLADLIYATDYYPFGLQIPERTYAARDSSTRYGFNEKEYDLWTISLKIQDYGFRSYNPATARFMSVDPLTAAFPHRTPYNFADNTPIWMIDFMGLNAEEPGGGDKKKRPKRGQKFSDEKWNGAKVSFGDVDPVEISAPKSTANTARQRRAQQLAGVYDPINSGVFGWSHQENLAGGSVIFGSLPFTGCAMSIWGYATGEDFFTGQNLTGVDHAVNTMGFIPFGKIVGKGAKFAGSLFKGGAKAGKVVTKGADATATVASKNADEVADATLSSQKTIHLQQFSASTIDEAVNWLMRNTDKVNSHIFVPKHKLGRLVMRFGSKRELTAQVLKAANGKLPSSGVFKDLPVTVAGQTVYLRGRVVNGLPKLGTFYVK